MSEFQCDNSGVVKIAQKLLDMAKESDITNLIPISKKDINNIKKALKHYSTDCSLCANNGNNFECHKIAEQKLMRSMPFLQKNIYPWNNYDWNYGNFVDNNYSVLATGATKSGKISALFKNMKAFMKLVKGYLSDSNPGPNSYPGKFAKDGDISYYECIGKSTDADGNMISDPASVTNCKIINKIKYGTKQNPPTDDSFLKKYPITGEKSSSYYFKIGTCPRTDIKSQKECEQKNYSWIPDTFNNLISKNKSGSCYQPRYAYINNNPGFKIGGVKFKGLIPSITSDFLALTPDKIIAAMEGRSIDNLFEIQQCPKIKEGFVNKFNSIYNKSLFYNLFLFSTLIFIIFLIKIKN